ICSWIDKAEIDIGDIILEKVTEGIEQATDFILFWSKSSAQSNWVKLELHMAFIRYMEDSGCKLKVVCLDDTELLLYLQPFLYLNVVDNLADLPSLLLDNLKSSTNAKAKRSQFVNRSEELGRLEQAIDNEETRIVTIFGIHGIGKKSLNKRTKEIYFDQANMVGIQVKPGLDLVALSLELAYKAEVQLPSVFNSDTEVKAFVRSMIELLHSRGFFIAFYDIQY